ncbi:MAG TPA: LEA type 2 family protein [Phycisphaerales bacterium]|nr:LEA type 2 family protein [Phycisphaerales bacterium]
MAVVPIAGCTSYAPPKFTVQNVTLETGSAEAMVLAFHVRGENSNDIELKLRDVRYEFESSGREKFEALRSAEATLPAKGANTFTVPVVLRGVPGGAEAPTEVSYKLAGSVEYLLPGSIAELLFDTGLRKPTTGFGESGRLDLSKVGGEGAMMPALPGSSPEAAPASDAQQQ